MFVTGHSHEKTLQPTAVGNALIVQAQPFGEALGRLRIDVDAGTRSIGFLGNALLETTAAPVDVNRGLLRLLEVVVLTCALVALFLSSAR